MIEKSGVEKSVVEKSVVEMSMIKKSGVISANSPDTNNWTVHFGSPFSRLVQWCPLVLVSIIQSLIPQKYSDSIYLLPTTVLTYYAATLTAKFTAGNIY